MPARPTEAAIARADDPDKLDEPAILKIIFRTNGVQEFSMPLRDATGAALDMRDHVKAYGFDGWRSVRGLLLDMREVQAVWVSTPETED